MKVIVNVSKRRLVGTVNELIGELEVRLENAKEDCQQERFHAAINDLKAILVILESVAVTYVE